MKKCWHSDPYRSRLSHPPLRMSENTFVSIAQAVSLPFSYLRMLKEGSTVFIDVQNVPQKANVNIQSTYPHIQQWRLSRTYNEGIDIMIQNSYTSTSPFIVTLIYEPRRRLTSALVHSISENDM